MQTTAWSVYAQATYTNVADFSKPHILALSSPFEIMEAERLRRASSICCQKRYSVSTLGMVEDFRAVR